MHNLRMQNFGTLLVFTKFWLLWLFEYSKTVVDSSLKSVLKILFFVYFKISKCSPRSIFPKTWPYIFKINVGNWENFTGHLGSVCGHYCKRHDVGGTYKSWNHLFSCLKLNRCHNLWIFRFRFRFKYVFRF